MAVGPVGTAVAASLSTAGVDSVAGARIASSNTHEARVRRHVNRERAAHGLRALRFERCTDGLAETWSVRLAATGGLAHQDTGRMLTTCGARYTAEASGRGGFSPKGLVRAWLRSPYQRAVLLSTEARRIGVGATSVGGGWVTVATLTRY